MLGDCLYYYLCSFCRPKVPPNPGGGRLMAPVKQPSRKGGGAGGGWVICNSEVMGLCLLVLCAWAIIPGLVFTLVYVSFQGSENGGYSETILWSSQQDTGDGVVYNITSYSNGAQQDCSPTDKSCCTPREGYDSLVFPQIPPLPSVESVAWLIVTGKDRPKRAARTWLRWLPPALIPTHLVEVSDVWECTPGPGNSTICSFLSVGSAPNHQLSQRKWRDGIIQLATVAPPSAQWAWIVDDDTLIDVPTALQFAQTKDPEVRSFYAQECTGTPAAELLHPIPLYCGGGSVLIPMGILKEMATWLDEHGGRGVGAQKGRAWPPQPITFANGTVIKEGYEEMNFSDVALSVVLYHLNVTLVPSEPFRSQAPGFYSADNVVGIHPVSFHYLGDQYSSVFTLFAAMHEAPLSLAPKCPKQTIQPIVLFPVTKNARSRWLHKF